MSEHFDRHLEELGPVDVRKQQELRERKAKDINASRMGRPAEWTDKDRDRLVELIDSGREEGKTLRDAIETIMHRLPGLYGSKGYTSCETVYYRKKRVAKLEPEKSHIAQVEQWGKLARPPLKPGEAGALVADLWASAGPSRQPGFLEIFEIAARKYGVTDHEKIEWLRWVNAKLKEHPRWWPRERPEIRDRSGRDIILKITSDAPGKQADFALYMAESGWSLDSVKNYTRRLRGDGELVGIAPGLFTLPGLGATHVPVAERVLDEMDAAPPGTEFSAVGLAETLGVPRGAVDSAFHGHGALVRDRKVRPVRRGVFVRGPAAR